jgi:type VI secretion system protein ImpE
MTTAANPTDLAAAISAQTEQVKAAPGDAAKRVSLAELLAVSGNLDRADAQLDIASTQDPSWSVKIALMRQLLRAEKTRAEVFAAKAVPELVLASTPVIEAGLRAILASQTDGADEGLSNDNGPWPTASINETASVTPFIDLDDRTRAIAEIMSSTGKYFWVPLTAIDSARFEPPATLFERIWRPCQLDIRGGPSGMVFWPALYPAAPGDTDAMRRGQETDWRNCGALTLGAGLRCFLAGDDIVPFDALSSLSVGES